MKFTKEEISLCKQIVGKHRKEIDLGDWIIQKNKTYPEVVYCIYTDDSELICTELEVIYKKNCTPLWTIFDCLEFLREKGWWPRIDFDTEETRIYTFHKDLSCKHWTKYPMYKGKTALEACLKAVLAVLEKKEEEVQCPSCGRWILIKASGCVCELEEEGK